MIEAGAERLSVVVRTKYEFEPEIVRFERIPGDINGISAEKGYMGVVISLMGHDITIQMKTEDQSHCIQLTWPPDRILCFTESIISFEKRVHVFLQLFPLS